MKKICYITTVSMTLRVFILETAKYIHKQTGWDITFVCDYDESFENSLPDYINYHPISMKRGISIAGINAMLEMKRLFQEQKFDLIQYSTPNASLYAAMAGKLADVPVRLYCQWGMAFVGFRGVKRVIFKSIEKYVCACSTWIEPDSESNLIYSHEQGLYPLDKGSVIWNGSACGINLDKFKFSHKEEWRISIRKKHSIPEGAFVFGFVGRITRDKGINELLKATKCIMQEREDVYLLFVGPDEADDTIDEPLLKWARLTSKVIFTGYTNSVEKYLSAMDVYVLPSYREGFGMGVVEAEAMGVPVIVTNIPGPIDAMANGETGIVVNKKSASGLTDVMKEMMVTDLHTMGVNGIKFAQERFDQQRFFEVLLEDRRRLLGL